LRGLKKDSLREFKRSFRKIKEGARRDRGRRGDSVITNYLDRGSDDKTNFRKRYKMLAEMKQRREN
jgi:hypothetical protein